MSSSRARPSGAGTKAPVASESPGRSRCQAALVDDAVAGLARRRTDNGGGSASALVADGETELAGGLRRDACH